MSTDMQHQAMGYDRTATMFSPDGHLLQVEYAEKTVRLGSASIGVAGIVSDARVLIERAQLLAQQHRITYDSPIETESIVKEIANMKQQFTQYGGARPFGVSMMTAGINGKKPELFVSDITGNYFSYHANAIGESDDKIKEKLREKYKQNLKIKEGIKLALEIFKEIKGNKFSLNKFELVYINSENKKIERIEGERIKEI
ncbi:proteasome subunit alpha [Candidatus Pacearchaeota archaeon]|nr:proteasome subunit alpha [Candidatus Pacearchaeota archaeon]